MATYDFILSSGLIIPDVSEILSDVNDEYFAIFGDDFVVDPETPEGALIATEATSRESVARNNAAVANQINPNFAGGPFLDATWALTGGSRLINERSIVDCDLTGIPGISISAGSIARTTLGVDFQLVTTTSLDITGNATAQFESVSFGPIPAGANTLNSIVSGVLGWETVNNPLAAVLGQNTESDPDSRRRRKNTLALQGRGTAEAVISLVSDVDGVRSVRFLENFTSATDTFEGILLVANSIWVSVQGGADQEVADAISEAKGGGANFNGDVAVDVTEPFSGQVIPVLFDRPTEIPVIARVTIRSGATIPTDPVLAVKQSIINYADGNLSGEEGFVVSADVSPWEFAGAINRENPELFVTLVEVSYQSPISFVTTTLPIETDEVATIVEDDIEVIIL